VNKELVEYYWNEQTETAEIFYTFTTPTGELDTVIETRHMPIKVETPSLETYWSQLKFWLKAEWCER
jgi:hypothetical protein